MSTRSAYGESGRDYPLPGDERVRQINHLEEDYGSDRAERRRDLVRWHPIERDLIAHKQRFGYVPEEPHIYPHLTGAEYLEMVGQLRGLAAKPLAEKVDGLLSLFSLHEDRHVAISSYSKGMRQKVLISAALLHNPETLQHFLPRPETAHHSFASLVLL